jgi:hypothetical protein
LKGPRKTATYQLDLALIARRNWNQTKTVDYRDRLALGVMPKARLVVRHVRGQQNKFTQRQASPQKGFPNDCQSAARPSQLQARRRAPALHDNWEKRQSSGGLGQLTIDGISSVSAPLSMVKGPTSIRDGREYAVFWIAA